MTTVLAQPQVAATAETAGRCCHRTELRPALDRVPSELLMQLSLGAAGVRVQPMQLP